MTVALEGLVGKLPRYGRLIGIDLGTRTIGLALSDVERRIASPLETLKRGKFMKDAAEIAENGEAFRSVGHRGRPAAQHGWQRRAAARNRRRASCAISKA